MCSPRQNLETQPDPQLVEWHLHSARTSGVSDMFTAQLIAAVGASMCISQLRYHKFKQGS
jgi:hypothetical protein